MANISINHKTNIDSTLNYYGEWWLPENPQNKVSGIFNFNLEAGGVLTLKGSLATDENEQFNKVIFGEVQSPDFKRPINVKLTLDHCIRINSITSFGENINSKETWICSTVFQNAHLEKPSTIQFSSLKLKTDLLDKWTALSRPTWEYSSANKIQANLEIPEEKTVYLSERESIKFQWLLEAGGQINTLRIELDPQLIIEANHYSLEDYHRQIIRPLLYFFTFCTGLADSITYLSGYISPIHLDPNAEIVIFQQQIWSPSKRNEPLDQNRILIQYEEIKANFENVIKGWIEINNKSRSIMNSYFSTIYVEQMYSDEKFLKIMSALEGWHRIYFNEELSPDYSRLMTIKEKVQDSLSKEERKLLSEKLGGFRYPSLRTKLDFLIQRTCPRLATYIASRENFSDSCVKTRNSLIHHYVPENIYVVGVEYLYAEQTLKCIYLNLVLEQLNFASEIIDKFLARSPEGRLIHLNSTVF